MAMNRTLNKILSKKRQEQYEKSQAKFLGFLLVLMTIVVAVLAVFVYGIKILPIAFLSAWTSAWFFYMTYREAKGKHLTQSYKLRTVEEEDEKEEKERDEEDEEMDDFWLWGDE